jgi:hypothetical protein
MTAPTAAVITLNTASRTLPVFTAEISIHPPLPRFPTASTTSNSRL